MVNCPRKIGRNGGATPSASALIVSVASSNSQGHFRAGSSFGKVISLQN